MKRIIVLLALVALAAAAIFWWSRSRMLPPRDFDKVSQQELCEAVSRVESLGKDDFLSIRGDKSTAVTDIFASKYVPPGMEWCNILVGAKSARLTCGIKHEIALSDVTSIGAYPAQKRYLETVHTKLAACLPPAAKTERIEKDGRYVILYERPGFPALQEGNSGLGLRTGIGESMMLLFKSRPD